MPDEAQGGKREMNELKVLNVQIISEITTIWKYSLSFKGGRHEN
jgi:hypothetical protein